uniref:Uncharacterized LOC105933608 n=1 Tax=Fundulus heteroclitus TaxID=8078 RepID=A0A3Q2R162_FUNHE
MSLTPSYEGESASASPESPGEGDFSSRQFYDNSESLEEHETCDERGPIVNKVPDNYSSAPLKAPICASLMTNDLENERAGISSEEQIEKRHSREPEDSSTSLAKKKLPASSHLMEVCTLDGRFITLVSTQTQTDRERVEQSLSFSCQVQREVGDLQMLPDEMIMDTVPVYLKETGDDETEEEYDVPCPGLPRLIAYRREPKQTLRISKLLEVEPEKNAPLAPCEFCQKLCQPFTLSESQENEIHFDRAFYCQEAKQIRELIQMEKEKLELKYYSRRIFVDTYRSTSREECETPKEPHEGRVKQLQQRRKPRIWEKSGLTTIQTEMRFQLPIPGKNAEIAGGTLPTSPTLDETYDKPKIKDVTQKFYKTGTCFRIMYSDGTGTVFYPSGKPAIVISSAEAAHFTYIILEDKDTDPSIKGIFATKGYSTCYHSNGLMWLNLTSGGGLCFSETGNLRRRWNWLYCDPHVHNLPFKPLTFALGPHISVRIHSQECVYVTFVHKENHVRFSVGSEPELICPESHDKSDQSILERFIQTKKTEIYSLLDQMQTCMSRPTANVQKIKPHYRFIAQKERLSKQVEKKKSPKKIKAHAN